MREPGSDIRPFSGDDHVALVGRHIVEGDGIGLNTTSAHGPDLVAANLVVEVLIVPGVWHESCRVCVLPRELNELAEGEIAKRLGKVSPAINLVVEIGIQSVLVVIEID